MRKHNWLVKLSLQFPNPKTGSAMTSGNFCKTTQAGLNASKEAQNYWKVSFYNIANFFSSEIWFLLWKFKWDIFGDFLSTLSGKARLGRKTTLLHICETTYMYYDNLFRVQKILLSVVG